MQLENGRKLGPEKTGNKLPNQTFKFLRKGLKLGNEKGKHTARHGGGVQWGHRARRSWHGGALEPYSL